MRALRLLLALGATFVVAPLSVFADGSSAQDTRLAAEGVSSLGYGPKPFYDDRSRMRVTFTTTGRAGQNREYYVLLTIDGPDTSNCADLAGSTVPFLNPVTVLGAPGRTYAVWLTASPIVFNGYFCRGRATLWVGTNTIEYPSRAANRVLRKTQFRILRAPHANP